MQLTLAQLISMSSTDVTTEAKISSFLIWKVASSAVEQPEKSNVVDSIRPLSEWKAAILCQSIMPQETMPTSVAEIMQMSRLYLLSHTDLILVVFHLCSKDHPSSLLRRREQRHYCLCTRSVYLSQEKATVRNKFQGSFCLGA